LAQLTQGSRIRWGSNHERGYGSVRECGNWTPCRRDELERIVEAHIGMKAWKRRAAEIERARALL